VAGYLPLLPLLEAELELAGGVFFAGRSPRAGGRTGLGFEAVPARPEEAFPERDVVAGFLVTRGLDRP
jgi:hypothetical protein